MIFKLKSKILIITFLMGLWGFVADAQVPYKKVIKRNNMGVIETVYVYTEHFFISYSPVIVGEKYVKDLANYLETSWKTYIDQWKFKQPSFTQNARIQVFLAKELKVGTMEAAGVVYGSSTGKSYMKIKVGLPDPILQDTSAHELFHIIQNGYDVWEAPWLKEATATAIQDEIFPLGRSYINFSRVWYSWWSAPQPMLI